MFASLRGRNYRIWFIGAFISNIGAWMQATAQNWVVLTELSENDALAVGFTMALQFGPQLLLVPISGMVADRFNKRHILMVTQSLLMMLALGLGILLISGIAELWHLYAFAAGLGIVNAFDTPARQSFVSELVKGDQITNAVALNSASFNSARLIGPAVAGVMIALIGSGWVFAVNAATFIATIIALVAIRLPKHVRDADEASVPYLRQLAAGFTYVSRRKDLVVIFVMVCLIGTFGMNFPIYSSTMAVEFGQGAGEYGVLSSILAVGSLVGALLVARRQVARMRVVILAAGGFGVSCVLAAAMPTYWTFAISLVLLGFCTATMLSTANAFVQTTTDAGLRGRVLSLYFAILMGGTPIGAPISGAVADAFGARWSLVVAGLSGVIAASIGILWLLTSRRLRLRRKPGSGFTVTHIGRSTIDGDRGAQVETLTASIKVLGRDPNLLTDTGSAPQSGALDEAVTGVIMTEDIDPHRPNKR